MTKKKGTKKSASYNLLEVQNIPLAIADGDQKIVWLNDKFKLVSGIKRIKGKDFEELFNI